MNRALVDAHQNHIRLCHQASIGRIEAYTIAVLLNDFVRQLALGAILARFFGAAATAAFFGQHISCHSNYSDY